MKKWLNGLLDDKLLFTLCLGLCPTLAVSTTFENGYLMGLFVFIIIMLSTLIMSLILKITNKHITLIYIIINAILVTILDIILQNNIEPLSRALGIYIPLIAVNYIIIDKYSSNELSIKKNIMDSLKIGLIYMISLSLISLVREIIGNNTITFMDKISDLTGYISKYEIFSTNDIIPNKLFIMPTGAFLIIGLLLGIIRYSRKDDTK